MRPGPPGPVCEIAPRARTALPGFGWIVLQRDGRRPLAIEGRVVLTADNACAGFAWRSEIVIYETAAGLLAVSLCHAGTAEQGPPWRDAFLSDDPAALRAALLAHDPVAAIAPCRDDDLAGGARAAQRFAAIWRGLLGALFGLRVPGMAAA